MTSQPASDDTSEKIEILYGAENIIYRTLQDLVNVKESFVNCTDYSGPSVFLAYPPMWNACIALKQRGVRLRFMGISREFTWLAQLLYGQQLALELSKRLGTNPDTVRSDQYPYKHARDHLTL
ncbi:MAG: hypothetical protein M3044_04025 [Thermoproteota archaeon]|nr:hypothetical protein [Thermoproteota archaeon]